MYTYANEWAVTGQIVAKLHLFCCSVTFMGLSFFIYASFLVTPDFSGTLPESKQGPSVLGAVCAFSSAVSLNCLNFLMAVFASDC